MRSLIGFWCFASLAFAAFGTQEAYQSWSLTQAIQVLNSSPWARHETYTQVISGVGSGVSGEKEIFNTFYVRFLSAKPLREALVRVQQLEFGYEELSDGDRQRFDQFARDSLLSGFGDWIVVAVSFRSNDPNEESSVRRFFEKETPETLKNKAFLSTEQFSQVRMHTYFPPRDEGIGAKFVFPRESDGAPIVSETSESITFELLDVPAASPRLRARFRVKDMLVNGKLVL